MPVLEPGEAAAVDMSAERLDLARAMIDAHVDGGRTPAVAAVVARRGEIVFAEARGEQRPGGSPLMIDHSWAIASAGKPMTAAVVMSLVEEGLVGIAQPVRDYLPELEGEGNDNVFVHHLLTHTAGWSSPMFSGRLFEMLGSGEIPDPPPGTDPLAHSILWTALHPERIAPVGAQMAYANTHYELLAEIVRRVTGGTLDAALRERVLEPLGMTRTGLIVDDALRPHLVQRDPNLPFGGGPEAGTPFAFQGDEFEASDNGFGAVSASPVDLAMFGQMFLDGGRVGDARLLAESTVRSMVTNRIPGVPALFGPRLVRQASWGYGFSVICEERWPWFGGGLVPLGSVTHPGAGGISYWIDFEHELVGVWFELITEMSDMMEPISGISHRFQDVITGAVLA